MIKIELFVLIFIPWKDPVSVPKILIHYAVPENIHTPPQKRLEFPGGGGFVRPKYSMKGLKLTGISRGGGGGAWIFSGTTHIEYTFSIIWSGEIRL